MTIREAAPDPVVVEMETFKGAHITIHAPKGSPIAERGPEELREAEQFVQALKKLLSPDEERADIHIVLEVDDSRAAETEVEHAGNGRGRPHSDEPVQESTFRIVDPRTSGLPVPRQLARHLISLWFGESALAAASFVDGIAGLAAAQAGIGPSVEESDEWVLSEIAEGRNVSFVQRRRRRRRAARPSELQGCDPVATSFVSFLVTQSGSEALRKYLEFYDPERNEKAANEAYHQPLAVLEEDWLGRLRRRANDGDALRTFLIQVWPLIKPYKWRYVEILFYLILAAGYNIVQPYSVKIFVDKLTEQAGSVTGSLSAGAVFARTLAPFVLLLIGLYVINGVASLRRSYAVSWLNQNILNTLQVRMYAHLQRLSDNFYVNARIGDIMSRINSDLDNVQSALSQVTNKALYRGFTVIGALTALVMLTRTSPELAIPILCIVPLFGMSYMALRTRNKQASREQRQRVGQTMATVQEHLSAQALIKAYGLEERFISDYRSRVLSLQRSKLRLAMLSAITDLSEDMTTGLAQLIVFGVGGFLVLRDHGTGVGVGDLAALLVLVKTIFSPIASLAGIGQTMQQATGSMERVNELFQEPVAVKDRPGAVPLPPLSNEIRFEGVTFRYGGNRTALRDLSLVIPAGTNSAIVGLSGSGKSTIVNLLLRFWDPEEGRILFDRNDLRDVTLASLRGQIGLVFQETFIFNTTLRANIAIGRPDATDAEIAAAAKAARLDSFIDSLPAGYDTIPGEHGAKLSSGQKQRIAIARAFLRDPTILVLDEATSALDAETEAGILETLSELSEGRTTVSVTHRISHAATADHVFVMDEGRLVENGTHAELMSAGGLYQRLFEEATGFATQTVPQPVNV